MVIPAVLDSPLLCPEEKEKFAQTLPSLLSGIKLYIEEAKSVASAAGVPTPRREGSG
jgi:hypothetical protein